MTSINNHMQEQKETLPQDDGTYKDPAGLMFSGKIKITDVETGEVLVEQRSE